MFWTLKIKSSINTELVHTEKVDINEIKLNISFNNFLI